MPLCYYDDDEHTYRPLELHLLPEYYAREAARFAGYRWGEWLLEKVETRNSVIGHWFAWRLFQAHEHDAVTLRTEAERAKARR